uniref:DUF6603 domain-containing protein n=1 Tax=Tanacetum cinerariifolium TaxID=118510 RepID=A0A6L2N8E0_TANCI|nr:hypothetical protein [Tanacetum cinerariifolium]
MVVSLYQVIPLELNLRSAPRVEPGTVLARLRQGQQVAAVSVTPAPPAGWLRVRADLQGTAVEGFVKAAYLKPVQSPAPLPAPPATLPNIPEARLPSSGPIRRNQNGDGPRVYDLTEANLPGRPGPTPTDQAHQLGAIVAYLAVRSSPRYAAGTGKTYCNIYAHDYCHLAEVYLPRVWWTRKALVQLAAGQNVTPSYGTTVQELNANSLYNWFEEFGVDFGWRRSTDLTEVQQAANLGQVCIVSGQRRDLNQPGHICAVVPETDQHYAIRKQKQVTTPLMSQAGASNFEYGGRVWWKDARFGRFAAMKTLFPPHILTNSFGWWRWAALLAGLATTSCEETTQQALTTAPPLEPAPVPLPSSAQLGYHRYVGTVGGRPALVEINLWLEEGPDRRLHAKLAGSLYYRTTGLDSWLGDVAWVRPDQWLETTYTDYTKPSVGPRIHISILCAEQPPGLPLLTGWYTPPEQRQALPVYLRESYVDGVRYELLHEASRGRSYMAGEGATDSTEVEQTYIHLLGSDTLRPALARLQCPPPEARRRSRLALAARLSPAGYYRDNIDVTLNEENLLGYKQTIMQGHSFSRYYQESRPCRLVDLCTGRPLTLVAQLRPGKLRQMQRLLTQQAQADTVAAGARAHWWSRGQLPPPTGGFEVTPSGWVATYVEPESQLNTYAYNQTLNWATLRPLLRPQSPLYRLLRVRVPFYMSALSTDRLPAQCPTPYMALSNVEDFIITTTGTGSSATVNLTLDVMTYNCLGRMVELSLWWSDDLQGRPFSLTAMPLAKQTFAAFEGQTPHTFQLLVSNFPNLVGVSARMLMIAFHYPVGRFFTFSRPFKMEQPNRCDQGVGLLALFPKNDNPRYRGDEKFQAQFYKGWQRLLFNQVFTPKDRIVISAVSAIEGFMDAVQAADSEVVSIGCMQKTLSTNGAGELPEQLWTFKLQEPTRYACLLRTPSGHGWDVTSTRTLIYKDTDGTVYSKQNQNLGALRTKIRQVHDNATADDKGRKKNYILDPLVRLGQDEAFQERQLIDARDRLHGVLDAYPYGRDISKPLGEKYYTDASSYHQHYRVGDYFQSDIGQAYLLNQDVNRPGQTLYYVGAALDDFFDLDWASMGLPPPPLDRNPANWLTTTPDPRPTNPQRPITLRERYERELITLYAQSIYDHMHIYLNGEANQQKGIYDDKINGVYQKTSFPLCHGFAALRPLGNGLSDLADFFDTSNGNFAEFAAYLGQPNLTLPPAYQNLVTQASTLRGAVTTIANTSNPNYQQLADLAAAVANFSTAIESAAGNTAANNNANPGLTIDWRAFSEQLVGTLIMAGLRRYLPTAYHWLALVGVFTGTGNFYTVGDGTYETLAFNLAHFKALLNQPTTYLTEYFGWGVDFKFDSTMQADLMSLLEVLGTEPTLVNADVYSPPAYDGVTDPTGRGIIFLPFEGTVGGVLNKLLSVSLLAKSTFDPNMVPVEETDPVTGEVASYPSFGHYDEFVLNLVSDTPQQTPFSIGSDLTLQFVDLHDALRFQIGPKGINFTNGSGLDLLTLSINRAIVLAYVPTEPLILIGEPDKTRLQTDGLELALDLSVTQGVRLTLKAINSQLFIKGSEGDSFLNSVFPDSTIAVPLSVTLSSVNGLRFNGANSLRLKSSPNLILGPVLVQQLTLGLESTNEHDLAIRAHSDLVVALGPVTVAASDVGVSFSIKKLTDPKDIHLGFDLPTGLGIKVTSDTITGGGYLYIDHANHKYAGVAQLAFKDKFNLTALGLLQTELPGNANAYSFLLLITATFTPIQLGLGFTLNGVGGLIGINRAADTDYLRGVVRSGGINQLLFPANVLDNPASALALVDTAFPTTEGRYVIGLLAKLGWGAPTTVITLDVALLIELPSPIKLVLLGVLEAILPNRDSNKRILKLRADFLGFIDFGSKRISFDASLSDSTVLSFVLTGSMAFRLYQGNNPLFVITAGGFHPSFQPPAGASLTGLKRLTLSFTPDDDLRITLASYFAVTSNTFNPFRVLAHMDAYVAIKDGDSVVLGVYLSLDVTGPGPWHIWGSATISVFGFDISIDVSATIGNTAPPSSLPAPDVHALILTALAAPDKSQPGKLFLDPRDALVLRQNVVPLGLLIEKYGSGTTPPINGNQFELRAINVGAGNSYLASRGELEAVRDFFAPDQYRRLSDREKLSSPSFQLLPCGVRVKSFAGLVGATTATRRVVEYETLLIDATAAASGTTGGATVMVVTEAELLKSADRLLSVSEVKLFSPSSCLAELVEAIALPVAVEEAVVSWFRGKC